MGLSDARTRCWSLSGLWLHVDGVECYMTVVTKNGTPGFFVCFGLGDVVLN